MSSGTDRPIILVIDDDAITLTAVAAILDMNGFECHCARDAEAALKAARGQSLDLIICDLNIGADDGMELCAEIKAVDGLADVPVLFLSNTGVPDAVRRAHSAGGTYCLSKPFDPYVLIELVEKALWMPHLVKSRLRRKTSLFRAAAI